MSARDTELRAQRVFAAHLAHDPHADGCAIDALCRAHPDLEASLRRLAHMRADVRLRVPHVALGRIASFRRRAERLAAARAAEERAGAVQRARYHQLERADRYVTLGAVAQGDATVVLHVWDALLERPLAMKVLDPPERSDAADEAAERFLAEAHVAASLEHPGIVPILDLGLESGGRLYFTMPLVEGSNLNAVFDRVRERADGWSLARALLVVGNLCDVITYAHSRGVVHRDLKPGNVIVGRFGEVHVVDWGLAKRIDDGAPDPAAGDGQDEPAEKRRPGATLAGTIAGTPPYMAPEQALGQGSRTSFRTDVYAIGAILYRLLAGRAPYAPRRGREDPAVTLDLIRRGPPTPLERVAPATPPELAAICARAMAWRPEDRYASVGDGLAADLHAFLESRVEGDRRDGFWAAATRRFLGRDRAGPAAQGAASHGATDGRRDEGAS